MDQAGKIDLARRVLGYGKALAPDRFPAVGEQVVLAWSDVLGEVCVPVGVWPEAVRLWAVERVSGRMVTPGDLVAAARDVVVRWESRPDKKRMLEAHREARQAERDRELAEGTFGISRGYVPVAVVEPRSVDPAVIAEALRVAGCRPPGGA